MKEMSYIEKAYYNLNTAFSLNFMVLQNLDRLLANKTGVMTSRDIFGEKSSAENDYNMYFEEFAEIRNEQMRGIRSFFSPEIYFESFKKNSEFMLAEYNSYLGKNVKYSDVFSERNIKNWEAFNQIFEDVENLKDISSLDSLKLNTSLGQFLIFYEDYKNWLSAYEIFEVLDNDITSYGNKSFYHGKPDNPDVFIMDFDDYHEYYEKITKFFSLNNKKPKKLRKAKATDETSPEYISMQTIIDFINKLEERIGYANTHLMEIGSIWSRLEYHFSHMSDGDFEVTQVYVHKNEILSLISAMLTFPELHELANQISLKFLGKNVELIENKTKENT